jgi:hypothetical protein
MSTRSHLRTAQKLQVVAETSKASQLLCLTPNLQEGELPWELAHVDTPEMKRRTAMEHIRSSKQ